MFVFPANGKNPTCASAVCRFYVKVNSLICVRREHVNYFQFFWLIYLSILGKVNKDNQLQADVCRLP